MRKALVVYVQKYEDEAIENLNKTAEEANELSGFLRDALPKGYQFQVKFMPEPKARDVLVRLKEDKEELLTAEKANPKERNLFIFVFIGHGFERYDRVEFLLCADALDYDMETHTTGAISEITLKNFADGFSNTDVVFWLDACRDRLLHAQGGSKACKLDHLRTVSDRAPKKTTSRLLTIFTCKSGECAKDDGETMRAVLDIMRERQEAKEEIELGSTLTEQWGERLNKTRRGNRQTPVAEGEPILLAPGKKDSLGDPPLPDPPKESFFKILKKVTGFVCKALKVLFIVIGVVLGLLLLCILIGVLSVRNEKIPPYQPSIPPVDKIVSTQTNGSDKEASLQSLNPPAVEEVPTQTNEPDKEASLQSSNSTVGEDVPTQTNESDEEASSQSSNSTVGEDVPTQTIESDKGAFSQSSDLTTDEDFRINFINAYNVYLKELDSFKTNFPDGSNVSYTPVFEFDEEAFSQTEPGARATFKYNGVEYAFCYCPAGAFSMGSPKSENERGEDEELHNVTLTHGFWMLETPVTQGLWQSVMGTNPRAC